MENGNGTYGHENGLMVGRRGHGANTVDTCGKTTGNSSRETAVSITLIVDTLKEGEGGWIGWGGCIEGTDGLNSDVSVADDIATLKFLGSTVVRCIGVGEGASYEVENLDIDGEIGVGVEVVARSRVGDDGGDHVSVGGDIAHDLRKLDVNEIQRG